MQTALFLATAVLVFQIYFWGTRLWELVQTARTVPEIDPERDSQLPPKPPAHFGHSTGMRRADRHRRLPAIGFGSRLSLF